jgi:hypothetical protein
VARLVASVALVTLTVACTTRTRIVERRTPAAVRADLHHLRGEVRRLESEIVKANEDRAALKERLDELERTLARPSRARTGTVLPYLRVPSPAPGACSGWLDLVDDHPWDVATACRILWCESRGDPNARNGRHVGLFQIADGPADPAANVALAASMWSRRGWQPWDASRRCWA